MKQPGAIAGGLIGLLIGDALGVPYEFHPPGDVPPLHLIEFAPPAGFQRAHHGVPHGTWSDDGAQALILLDSLLERDGLDLTHFSSGLRRWLFEGFYAVNRSVFDIGAQTSTALNRLGMGVPPESSGPADESHNGNGSLMRVLPLALWHTGTDRELVELAARQSLPTHGHARAQVTCAIYCLWARAALDRVIDPWQVAMARFAACGATDLFPEVEIDLVLDSGNAGKVRGSGYVVDTLWSAKAAVDTTDNYEDCVRRAIAFGHDTDTTAAVAGGIAGVLYGLAAIPERWRSALRGRELYQPLLDRLESHLEAARAVRISAETIAAYNATTYRVDVPNAKIELRIGVTNSALAALHSEQGVVCSVFVTACNPFGAALTDEENVLAMGTLIAHLDARGITWLPGAGAGNDGDWPPEPSVLALGIDLAGAQALCIKFTQNAVVVCGADATPRLVLHPGAIVESR